MHAAAFLAACAITLAPWLIRNVNVGVGPAISTTGGVNLWMGNNPGAKHGGYHRNAQHIVGKGEGETDRAYRDKALHWITENPDRYRRLCGVRLARLLGVFPDYQAAKYLTPTKESDDAIVAAYRARRSGADETDLVERGRAIEQRNADWLMRLRWISAPLTIAAIALMCIRFGKGAIFLLPAMCYAAGLSATYFAERFREPWNALVYPLIAAAVWACIQNSPEFGFRSRRLNIAFMLAAVGIGVALIATGTDERYYRLLAGG
ncbi:MAG: hypothetical protein KDA32_12100 [Phycisphaerales bacterium]|nr:hypothetical protein [Phycisphaerales bacterium]